MKIHVLLLITLSVLVWCVPTQAQVKRTLTKTDKFDFGAGGTVSIAGAPIGSIKVIASNRNEVEITAEIEITAPTEADLNTLSTVTGFAADDGMGRATIVTVGTHNKLGPKDVWKKFPKKLMGLPFRIDYTVSVPHYCDLEIDGGKGDLSISGVEGAMRVNFLEATAKIEVIGGSVSAVFGAGKADIGFGTHGFRSRNATVQMGKGDLVVRFPAVTSADIDAAVLTSGKVENELSELKPRDRKVPFTDRSMMARAGVGGAQMKFTVADGSLKLTRLNLPF